MADAKRIEENGDDSTGGWRARRTPTGETERQMVERHVAQGARQVARQQRLVDEMDSGSGHAELSQAVLETLKVSQRAHERHLERLKTEERLAKEADRAANPRVEPGRAGASTGGDGGAGGSA